MHVHTALSLIKNELAARFSDDALREHYAWWILEAITQQSRAQLMTAQISPKQKQTIDAWLHALVHEHTPLAYLIGSVPFGDLTINVRPPILIPRNETEAWVHALIEKLMPIAQTTRLKILDLCTGSGCIALALAHKLNADVYAIDISADALALARENAHKNGITNVTFIASDLFEKIPTDLRFDLIVANPPYIGAHEWGTLEPSVKQWEDVRALIAADDGYALIKQIAHESRAWLNADSILRQQAVPQLMIEIGHAQGKIAQQLCRDAGWQRVDIMQDIYAQERDRVIAAHF